MEVEEAWAGVCSTGAGVASFCCGDTSFLLMAASNSCIFLSFSDIAEANNYKIKKWMQMSGDSFTGKEQENA